MHRRILIYTKGQLTWKPLSARHITASMRHSLQGVLRARRSAAPEVIGLVVGLR